MPYSFIEPVYRSPFSQAVRKAWYAVAALLALMLSLAAFLHFKSGELKKMALQELLTQESLGVQVEQMREQQHWFEREKMLRQETYTANQLVADRVADLLDLIPDDATLERFDMNASSVRYEGTCKHADAVKTELVRAFSGQYRLVESAVTGPHFRLLFAVNGDAL